MIDKIKDAKTTASNLVVANNNDAGALATKVHGTDANAGAKTRADLASAVALRAMMKTGKFSVQAGDATNSVKATAISAVNKVLGILDLIIRKTVSINQIRETVKGIQYSETVGTNATEASTTQTSATK